MYHRNSIFLILSVHILSSFLVFPLYNFIRPAFNHTLDARAIRSMALYLFCPILGQGKYAILKYSYPDWGHPLLCYMVEDVFE